MKPKDALEHALRGFCDDLSLHLMAAVSLVIVFFSLGFALLFVENVARLEARWAGERRLSIYLTDDASDDAVSQLRLLLASLEEVIDVTYVSPDEAERDFLAESHLAELSAYLPEGVFPGSVELRLRGTTTPTRIGYLARRVGDLSAVAGVETYDMWFTQLSQFLRFGKALTAALAVLAGLCVAAVIASSIQLAMTRRRPEIEVMRLCGATDTFVRIPFLLEGSLQGAVAALVSTGLLLAAYAALRPRLAESMQALLGLPPAFLGPVAVAALLFLGGAGGALGSAWTLYKFREREG